MADKASKSSRKRQDKQEFVAAARKDFRIVGIGASAGGLESLAKFFSHLPPDPGMAFVVIQHLSPDFRSMMDELLSRESDMPVLVAEHNVDVQPNHIYLLPPRKEMVIRNRRLLQLSAADRPIRVKILATDVHSASLAAASEGIYREEQLGHVSDARLGRFFSKTPGGYQISQDLRHLIVFAPHNVTKDAPFTNMHLISCRNMLIYLEPAAQTNVLSLFHFGLAAGGFLFLGASEATGHLDGEFDVIDEHSKVYRKKRDTVRLPYLRMPARRTAKTALPVSALHRPGIGADLVGTYDELLDRFMPLSFLVDEAGRLIDTFAGAERLFKIGPRRPSTDVLSLLQGDLRTVVAAIIPRALKNGGKVRYTGIPADFDGDGRIQRHRMTAERIKVAKTGAVYVLISLEPESPPKSSGRERRTRATAAVSAREAPHERLSHLESELAYTRETLQTTIEELQTSNEELQATNEELVASNEELQSTNEELHSVNEELYTVNAEYQKKIQELRELNTDMQHFLDSADVGTLFLDSNLRIRKYTPRMAAMFHIQPQDLGRSIRHLSHTLDRPDLVTRFEEALKNGTVVEEEMRDLEGATYFARILPHRGSTSDPAAGAAGPGPIEGVILSLTEISQIKRAQQEIEKREAQIRLLLDSTAEAIFSIDPAGRCTLCNSSCARMLGFDSSNDLIGVSIHSSDSMTTSPNLRIPSDFEKSSRGEAPGFGERMPRLR